MVGKNILLSLLDDLILDLECRLTLMESLIELHALVDCVDYLHLSDLNSSAKAFRKVLAKEEKRREEKGEKKNG